MTEIEVLQAQVERLFDVVKTQQDTIDKIQATIDALIRMNGIMAVGASS
jgi:hypothetical protein